MRTVVIALWILAVAWAIGAAAAPQPAASKGPAVIKQETLTFVAVRGLWVEFKNAGGQVLKLWLTSGTAFRSGRPADAKDLGVKPGKKFVIRYSTGGQYDRLLAVMDDASVPVFAQLINPKNGKLVTVVKGDAKSVTCRIGGKTRTYPAASSFFCAKDGHEAEIVAEKPADGKTDRVFVSGEQAVLILTSNGMKALGLVDKPMYDKFIATMTKP